jgi:RNA polymerase sigma factor (sigma-70 family)
MTQHGQEVTAELDESVDEILKGTPEWAGVADIPEELVTVAKEGYVPGRKKIMMMFMPMVRIVVHQLVGKSGGLPQAKADLIQEGLLSVGESILKFVPGRPNVKHPDRTIKFHEFAYWRLRHHIQNIVSQILGRSSRNLTTKKVRVKSLDAPLTPGAEESGVALLHDPDPGFGGSAEDRHLESVLRKILMQLPGSISKAMNAVYLDGLTEEQAARRFGVKRSEIQWLLAEGRKAIRERYPDLKLVLDDLNRGVSTETPPDRARSRFPGHE